ncbi:MAG: hypothetical protein CL610_25625 [Anaerolineaceae bacterium]|nr:hypothetical protein [Anaerolineaceae bacterium]
MRVANHHANTIRTRFMLLIINGVPSVVGPRQFLKQRVRINQRMRGKTRQARPCDQILHMIARQLRQNRLPHAGAMQMHAVAHSGSGHKAV